MATVLIVSGILTSDLGLLDTFLSKPQKDHLDDWVLRIWNFLSDARRFSLIGWLLRREYQIVFFVIACSITGTYFFSMLRHLEVKNATDVGAIVAFLVAIAVGWLVGVALLRRIFNSRAAPALAIVYLLCAVISWAILWSLTAWAALSAANTDVSPWGIELGDILFSVWVWIVGTGFVVVVFLSIAAAPLLVVTALQGLLFLSELIVRRIAESPKGIVMTLSGLATAIGAALKTFS